MGKRNRADSTEALLDVIRDDGEQRLNFPQSASKAPRSSRRQKKKNKPSKTSSTSLRTARPSLFSRSRSAVLGVDIAQDTITVVKMTRGDSPKLLDIQSVALESGLGVEEPGLSEKLQSVLGRVGSRGCDIWVLHRAPDVEIGVSRIPRVKRGELANTVYWQLQKERRFNSAEFVLDFRVQDAAVKEGEVPKIEVLTSLAGRADVERLRHRFRDAGYSIAGVTAIPAAFQNIYRTGWAASRSGLTANLHVGATFSSITIYEGAGIRFSRSIKFGLDSMAEELLDSYNRGELTKGMPGHELDQHGARLLILEKLLDGPRAKGGPGGELNKAQVLESVRDSLERVARQAERTLDYYAQNFHQRCETLHLSGRIFGSPEVAEYVSGQLALDMEIFDPLGDLDLSRLSGRTSLSGRMAMNEAVAVALSDQGKTLNFSHNYQARRRDRTRAMVGNAVSVFVMVMALLLGGLYVWSGETIADLTQKAREMEERIMPEMALDEASLARLSAEVGAYRARMRNVAERYEALAVLTELQRITPERVRLLNMNMELRVAPGKGTAQPAAGESPVRLLVLDMVILGGEENFETDLTRYLIALKASPLFGDVVVQQGEVRDFIPEGDVFHVVLHVQMA
ncbi:Tfp pilus assembly protein, ATPase PilM [Paucidesulfovibrio gracilis DSM 16080]|uniref:Tfp pilus assembly protein, ATPase PilM n=1 Tax=Paucidesulfovibrio gracilis DSM 16080 TaxID=1121449 RepID=A0A1T4W9Y9_9BACT|nr:hypothetical protein [Paucidesulfovibrio gracilis]SKA74100.1 Tfp pilus assembly protein, ATPase PilM [Paucidesulfovibrio gracilis DSM 16080]